MKNKHVKYPKIPQFRDVAYDVGKISGGGELPVVDFSGTVKLHGTNAGIQLTDDGRVLYQSRNRIIAPNDDNLGFASWADSRARGIINCVYSSYEILFTGSSSNGSFRGCTIYGEFCGKGIQRGVAIGELDKFYVIFGIYLGDTWLDLSYLNISDVNGVYNCRDFGVYKVSVDFASPEGAINEIYKLTQDVETECPAGKALGVTGIGEGIVWSGHCDGYNLRFKSKGQKHSKSKVKKHNPIDAEKADELRSLAVRLMTEERLRQGFDYLNEMNIEPSMKGLGDYLRYVVSDCVEEESIRIEESGHDKKAVGKALTVVAKNHFIIGCGALRT